jgi:hypothetical protein
MKSVAKIGGGALVVFCLAAVALVVLDGQRSGLGFEDADNPRVMIWFLQQRLDLFTYTGIVNVVMGISLAVAALALWDALTKEHSSMLLRLGTLAAFAGSAFFFVNGVLRIQAPGTLLHMADMDSDWGISGYVALQIVGTQGLASAGGFSLAIWEVSIGIVNFSSRIFWVGFSWLGILAGAGMLFFAFVGPLLPDSGLIYPVYVVSILFVLIVWCLLVGINLLSKREP